MPAIEFTESVKILPRSSDAWDVCLSAQPAFGSDFAGYTGYFAGEPIQLIDHRVESFFQLQDFTAHVHRDFARQVAAGDSRCNFRDVTHLASQVAGHEVHVVGEILPRAADAGHLRLAAELAFRTDFASHTSYFARERVQLVHHRVDGVFQFENFAFYVNRDFAGQIAASHSRRDFGDVSYLGRQVAGHSVDGVGQIFPGAGDARHDRLSAEFAVRADFASHAGYFGSERPQLVHHRIDGFFQLENFAAHIDCNLARQIAAGHGSGNFCDVAHLAGQVAGHEIDVVGEILPGAGHIGNLRLPAQFAFRSYFAGNAGYLGGEHAELLNHRVDQVGRAQKFAFQRPAIHVKSYSLRQVTLRNGCDRACDFRRGTKQIFHQSVDRNFHLPPGASGFVESRTLSSLALLADHLAHALQFPCHVLVGRDNLVKRVGHFPGHAYPGTRQANAEVAVAHALQAGQYDRQVQGSIRIFWFSVAGFPAVILCHAGRKVPSGVGRSFVERGSFHCFP